MAQLSPRELATVLAALRYWQADVEADPNFEFGDHFAEAAPLTAEEIDDLCERLNS